MKIMVSACLAGENCKYSGGNNLNEKVMKLLEGNEVIPVCPEQLGGLPTPRVPSEIRDNVVTAKDGRIVDAEFRKGAEICLETARREKPDLIILMSRSPSCGVNQRYDGTFTGTLTSGSGVTAQLLKDYGFPVLDVEDLEEFQKNFRRRFKTGSGWKACHDEAAGQYFGEYGGIQSYHLYELTEEQFDSLNEDMPEYEASAIMYEGRHLYMSVDDRCGPPYTIVFDHDYEKLCPWAKVMRSGRIWSDALTDAAVELFASEENNRGQRRKRREEKEKEVREKSGEKSGKQPGKKPGEKPDG